VKNRLIQIAAVAAMISGSLSGADAANSDKKKIHDVIENYEQVLNAGDVTATGTRVGPHPSEGVWPQSLRALHPTRSFTRG